MVDDRAVVDVGLGHGVDGGEIGTWPGARVVVAPEQKAVGELRLWHAGTTPPAGLTGLSVTPTPVRVTFPVLVTMKV